MKSIVTLEEGQYEVEFVREEARTADSAARTNGQAGDGPKRANPLSRCVLRVVGSNEDLEDTSRATAASPPGTKFLATVTHGLRYAAFKPLGAPANNQGTAAAEE